MSNDSHDMEQGSLPPQKSSTGQRGRAGGILTQLPTILVLAALLGVAVWGHRTGWKAGPFSQFTASKNIEAEDWCAEHNVPDSRCIKCHPELVGQSTKDWCPEHGVPESKCTLCHPEILQTGVAGDWCPEHGVPETSCTLCHPEIAVKGKALDQSAEPKVILAPPTTEPVESGEAGLAVSKQNSTSKPAKDPKTCQTHALRVQFASPESVRRAGVRLGMIVNRPMTSTVSTNSETDYDRTRVAQVSSPLAGRASLVFVEVGQKVKAGEALALIDAPEVGRAKAELLQAIADHDFKQKTLDRVKTSAQSGLRTANELQKAGAGNQAAFIRLFNAQQTLTNLGLPVKTGDVTQATPPEAIRFLGIPPELVKTFGDATSANLLPIYAPLDGVVISREIVSGEMIDPAKPLFIVADTTRMWVLIDLAQEKIPLIQLGQMIFFQPEHAPDQGVKGVVSWISTAVDDQTRTVKIRAEVDNSHGDLLAHTFGTAHITIRETPNAIAVPNAALQWDGCCHIVFVRLTDDIFQVRKVGLGVKDEYFTEVPVGLLPGEVVATEGSHVLKSEILKSALGAGCVCGQ